MQAAARLPSVLKLRESTGFCTPNEESPIWLYFQDNFQGAYHAPLFCAYHLLATQTSLLFAMRFVADLICPLIFHLLCSIPEIYFHCSHTLHNKQPVSSVIDSGQN